MLTTFRVLHGQCVQVSLFSTFIDVVQTGDLRFAAIVALVVWILFLAWFLTESYLAAHHPIPADLRRLGDQFIQAFGVPLIQRRLDEPPIRARLRFVPERHELEILIAPNGVRTYPNLSDHKSNVEYDVHRVLRAVGALQFVSGQLHAEGKWVVIPIRRKADSDSRKTALKEGVK
jgi:hypothetical protein